MHSMNKVKGHRNLVELMEIFYILLMVVLSWVYTTIKTHRIDPFKIGGVYLT